MKEKKQNNKEESTETEDEVVSVNLQTIVILVVIILIIIGTFIYLNVKNSDDEISTNTEVASSSEPTGTSEETEFNEDEAIELLKEYLNIKTIAVSNPQSVLETYGFATNQQFSKYEKTEDETFIKTDIIYEEIRNEFQNYITKDFFAKEYKNIYKNSNGVTHVANKNETKVNYEITRFERVESKTKPVLQVWYKTTTDESTSEEKSMKVEYTNNNSKWIISNMD